MVVLTQKNRSSVNSIFNEDITLNCQGLHQRTPNKHQSDLAENMKFLDLELCKFNKEIIKSPKTPKLMTSNNFISPQHIQTYNTQDNVIIPRMHKLKIPEMLSIEKTLKSPEGQRENYNTNEKEHHNPQEIRRSNEFQQDLIWSFGNTKELFMKSARTESNHKPLNCADLKSARQF